MIQFMPLGVIHLLGRHLCGKLPLNVNVHGAEILTPSINIFGSRILFVGKFLISREHFVVFRAIAHIILNSEVIPYVGRI